MTEREERERERERERETKANLFLDIGRPYWKSREGENAT